MTTSRARKPDLESDAWADSLDIASNMSTTKNPIGDCVWFMTNSAYKKDASGSGSNETFTFSVSTAKKVVEKKVIGNHTFFRVEGY